MSSAYLPFTDSSGKQRAKPSPFAAGTRLHQHKLHPAFAEISPTCWPRSKQLGKILRFTNANLFQTPPGRFAPFPRRNSSQSISRTPFIFFVSALFLSPPPSRRVNLCYSLLCSQTTRSFQNLAKATYRVTFDTEAYFEKTGAPCFYPEVAVLFRVEAPEEHYHIPLLISPFGYSTYRGS